MIRVLLVLFVATACAVFAYGDPARITTARNSVTEMLHHRAAAHSRIQQVPRGNGGEFRLDARINGVKVPMVIDTGATSVVLTYETRQGRRPAAGTVGLQRYGGNRRRQHPAPPG